MKAKAEICLQFFFIAYYEKENVALDQQGV